MLGETDDGDCRRRQSDNNSIGICCGKDVPTKSSDNVGLEGWDLGIIPRVIENQWLCHWLSFRRGDGDGSSMY